jgi:hypothetical protein
MIKLLVEIFILEVELWWWSRGFDLGNLRREADAVKVALDRRPVGDGGDDSHAPAAVFTDFNGETERSSQKSSPEKTIRALTVRLFHLFRIGFFRDDFFAVLGMGREDAVVPHQVFSRRRHEGGEFFYEL